MTNLGPAVTLLLAMLFRLESLKLKTGVGQAKLVGTMIGVTGATILTFYKGVALKSSSKNIHSSQENHHQIAGTNNFLGLLTALGSCISRAIWLIMQGIVTSGLVTIAIVRIVESRGPVFVSAFNPMSLVFVAIISSLMLGEQMHLGR
ncbi:WAT1-related protein At1g25270 [Linum perenne]